MFLLMAMSFGKTIIHDSNQEVHFLRMVETPLHQRHKMDLPMDLMRNYPKMHS